MSWPLKPLSEVADFRLGKMLDQKKNTGELLPYLANLNVQWSGFSLENLREMRFETHERERYGLKRGDIVMCEGGEPGRCSIWKEQMPGMMYQKALHRIRPCASLDYRFLYFNLRKQAQNGELSGLFTGSTIKHLPREKLALVQVPIPPISDQKRIADILSAYDDLIENNQRRIALLEESARLLYREWFVHFRFPGHEHVKIIDGFPEGWARFPLSELAKFVNGFAFKPSHLGNTGLPIVKIPELRDGVTHKTPRNEGDLVPRKYHLKDGDLLFSWSGTLAVNIWAGGSALLNQHLFDVIPTARVGRGFLMFALREKLAEFLNSTVGATMKHIRRSALDRIYVALPNSDVTAPVEELLENLYPQLTNLRQKNMRLTQARDLLLPRLMNGEIAV